MSDNGRLSPIRKVYRSSHSVMQSESQSQAVQEFLSSDPNARSKMPMKDPREGKNIGKKVLGGSTLLLNINPITGKRLPPRISDPFETSKSQPDLEKFSSLIDKNALEITDINHDNTTHIRPARRFNSRLKGTKELADLIASQSGGYTDLD